MLLSRLSKVMVIVTSVSAAVLLSIIIMMIITGRHPPFLLTFAVGLSYIVAIFSLGLLASHLHDDDASNTQKCISDLRSKEGIWKMSITNIS